jgi:hypothetical protein
MGRFSVIVLFLAACGDNSGQPSIVHTGGQDTFQPGGVGVPTPIYVPEVCGDLSWTTNTRNTAIDVSVVPRSSGAQVLTVPLAGGSMTGYSLDKAMNMQTIDAQLSINDKFTAVSASEVDGRLVATGVDATSIRVDLVADDLSGARQVAKLLPGTIADPAFQVADGINIVPVADAQGLRLETFDSAWNLTTTRVANTEAATGITAAKMDYSTVAAWSTATSCYMMTLFTAQPGPLATMPEACTSPRLAVDGATQHGQLVFESSGNIRILATQHTSFDGVSQLLRTKGTAPRVLWDGERFWISYLDQRGNIVVGYLDGGDSGHYISTAIDGATPVSSAYDLVMIAHQVWAVSFDETGYTAHRVCMENVN